MKYNTPKIKLTLHRV